VLQSSLPLKQGKQLFTQQQPKLFQLLQAFLHLVVLWTLSMVIKILVPNPIGVFGLETLFGIPILDVQTI
jgi:hypothetical protein